MNDNNEKPIQSGVYNNLLEKMNQVFKKPEEVKVLLDTIRDSDQLTNDEWSELVRTAIKNIEKCLWFDENEREILFLVLCKLGSLVTAKRDLPLTEDVMIDCLDLKLNLKPKLKQKRTEQGFSLLYFFRRSQYENVRSIAARGGYAIDFKRLLDSIKLGEESLIDMLCKEFNRDDLPLESVELQSYLLKSVQGVVHECGIPAALCTSGVDIEFLSFHGFRLIGHLFEAGYEEELQQLLVNKNMKNLRSHRAQRVNDGLLNLLASVAYSNNFKEIKSALEFLLKNGADPNAYCPRGETPLHEVQLRPETAEMLLTNGADPNKPGSPNSKCAEICRQVPLVLHLCMVNYHTDLPRFLYLLDVFIEHGAKINDVQIDGRLLDPQQEGLVQASLVDIAHNSESVRDFLRYALFHGDAQRVLELIKIWKYRKNDCPHLGAIPAEILYKNIIGEHFKVSPTRPLRQTLNINKKVATYIQARENRRQQERDAHTLKTLIALYKFRTNVIPMLARVPRDVFYKCIIGENFAVSSAKPLLLRPGAREQ